jgi:hypothetical protein
MVEHQMQKGDYFLSLYVMCTYDGISFLFQCVVMSAIRTTDYSASPQHEGFISEVVCSTV